MKNDGKIVFLDIYPYHNINKEYDKFDFPDVVTIHDSPSSTEDGGIEYLIDTSTGKDFFYDYRTLRLKGYFKILGILGPQQGFFSATLRPVNIEDAESLKK
jgi:hypothetical protein